MDTFWLRAQSELGYGARHIGAAAAAPILADTWAKMQQGQVRYGTLRVPSIVAESGKSIIVSLSESVSETVHRCLKQGIGTDSASESGNGKLSNTVCGNYGAVDATGARGAAFHRRRAPETSYSVRSQIWIFECTVLLMILQMVHYGDHCRPSGLSAGCATFF